jgi:hypothetical protein
VGHPNQEFKERDPQASEFGRQTNQSSEKKDQRKRAEEKATDPGLNIPTDQADRERTEDTNSPPG